MMPRLNTLVIAMLNASKLGGDRPAQTRPSLEHRGWDDWPSRPGDSRPPGPESDGQPRPEVPMASSVIILPRMSNNSSSDGMAVISVSLALDLDLAEQETMLAGPSTRRRARLCGHWYGHRTLSRFCHQMGITCAPVASTIWSTQPRKHRSNACGSNRSNTRR